MAPITSSGRSPFEIIPLELTLQIFTAYLNVSLPHTRIALCNLCLTCRQWKDIVYGTAELWAIIGITISSNSTKSLVDAISMWLNRSNQHPLRISLNVELSVLYRSVVDPILYILHEEIHRWSDISFSGYFDLGPISQTSLFKPNPVAPILESLEINMSVDAFTNLNYDWIVQLMRRAPNLRTFIDIGDIPSPPMIDFVPFTQLSVVKIGSTLPASSALAMFASMPKLSVCHINLADNERTTDQQAHIVVCYAYELKVGIRRSFKLFGSILSPNLRKFELHFLQHQLVLPLEETPIYGFLTQVASTLACFTIRNLFMKDTDLLCCLKILSPRLKSLQILADQLRPMEYYDIENVTDLVISALHYNTNEEPLCPKLEVLTLQRCMSATDGLLSEMVASRMLTRIRGLVGALDSTNPMSGLYFFDVVFRYHSNPKDTHVLEGLHRQGLRGRTRHGYS